MVSCDYMNAWYTVSFRLVSCYQKCSLYFDSMHSRAINSFILYFDFTVIAHIRLAPHCIFLVNVIIKLEYAVPCLVQYVPPSKHSIYHWNTEQSLILSCLIRNRY